MCLDDPLIFFNDIWIALSRPILQDPATIITRLTDAMNHLQSQSEYIQNRMHGGEIPSYINDWLTEVADIDAKVTKIVTDHRNGSFRWCINCRATHCLADVTALAEKYIFEAFTPKLQPNAVREIPGGPWIDTPTMNANLSKLRAYFQEDGSGIIGIWGMGGVGKTTLLRRLNNELLPSHNGAGQSKPMFDLVIWAEVSRRYHPSKLRLDIANRLGLTLSNNQELEHAIEINNFLKNKNFLLLLDDLWEPVDLAELGIPSPRCIGAKKKLVVFTTRIEGVFGRMLVMRRIKIECLGEAEAWQFFEDKVGRETLQADPGIPKLAKLVVKECNGLPLALTLIGNMMRMKTTVKEWEYIITMLQKPRHEILGMDEIWDEIRDEIQSKDDKIFVKLKFSYDNLVDEILKKCFLLCSLWPEDYSISKEDLIECWMGHGLINEREFDNINGAYDYGYSLIGGLKAACLLEPGDNKDTHVKMHDVVRDFALWIASDYDWKLNRFVILSKFIASKNLHGEVERLSIFHININDTSCLPADCSKLETLMVRDSYFLKSMLSKFFQGTRVLTYLDLSGTSIDSLPEEIGLLGNLRYLNLSDTEIRSLPLQLGNLLNLRFLHLRQLFIISIPRGVLEKLVMLSVIDMTNTLCNNWQELLKLCGSLKGLGITLESIVDLRQLAKLPNVLTWRLVLRKLLGFNEPLQLLSPSLLGSCSIRSSIQMLKIENCEGLEVVSMESDEYDGIQKWCLSRLEELELQDLVKLKEVVWRGVCPGDMLPSLTVINISGCQELTNISWVIRLPSLEKLTVLKCRQMQQIIDDDSEFAHCGEEENSARTAGPTFPRLRSLHLSSLPSLKAFGGSFTFPSLKLLHVIDCPNMKILPFGAEMA